MKKSKSYLGSLAQGIQPTHDKSIEIPLQATNGDSANSNADSASGKIKNCEETNTNLNTSANHHINPSTDTCNLFTVSQFSNKHKAFTPGSLRWLIFNSKNRESTNGAIQGNGMGEAIVRVGRRVLIDEYKFFKWINSQN